MTAAVLGGAAGIVGAQAAGAGVNAGMWWITLGVGAVVVAVVALLLALVLASARRIRGVVSEIWVVGPAIARNTAHLDLLRRINLIAGDVLERAGQIGGHAGRIQEHAEGCAGCPRCVTGWS